MTQETLSPATVSSSTIAPSAPSVTVTPTVRQPEPDLLGDEVESLLEELYNLLQGGDALDDVPGS